MKKVILTLLAGFILLNSNIAPNLHSKTFIQPSKTTVKKPPDFKAVDIDGKTWTLEDFAGKYVYIDIWATWCPPCRKETPHLRDLEASLKDSKVVILGLSIDEDKSKWESAVRSGNLPGTQLFLGVSSPFLQAYGVRSIPRFILIDPQGNIVDANMSRPSSSSTLKFLKEL